MTALPNPGWKRCLSFFYCIILPFDLVTLKRMSYNVESAKSVLFYQVCNLFKNNVKDFLCNIHITKITKMLYMVSRCHCLTNDYYVLWQYYDTLQLYGRCYGWHPLWYPIFISFCACFSYVICFLFLFFEDIVCNLHHECHWSTLTVCSLRHRCSVISSDDCNHMCSGFMAYFHRVTEQSH